MHAAVGRVHARVSVVFQLIWPLLTILPFSTR